MANDLVTRLLLNSQNFDNNIRKSTQQMQTMQRQAATVKAGMASAFMGIGAAVGAAMTVQEGFNKLMNSSQILSDEFGGKMEMAKSSVNEFFYSLGSGDWSNFLSGIGETISKAEDLYKALDQLGNTRMSYDYFSSKYDENIETARTKATDTSLSKEERATGFEEWQTALDEKNKAAGVLQERIVDGLNKSLVNGTKLNAKDVSFADFENIVAIDLLGVGEAEKKKEQLANSYKQFVVKNNDLSKQINDNTVATDLLFPESDGAKERAAKIEDLKKRQQELNLQYKDAILYNQNLVKLKDEEWQKTLNLGKENRIVTTQILNQQRAYNKQKNSFENKNSGGSKTPPPPASGSIAKIDAQITEAQKSYANATSNEARIAAQKTIDALNGQKIQLVAEITETMFREKYSYDANKGSQKMSGIKKSGIDTKNMQLDKIESPITDEMIAKNFDYAASFAYINTALNAMGNATNEATSSWLNYSANVIAGVAAMIPSIATLFKGKAALAIAEQAGLPVPLNFIAMGATGAALAATIASIPKFASGGVFGGNSTIGDMNLARVNSGEMILNHSQQGRLFSMLNNGESFNNNKGTAQAEFTIKGRNLDAILKKNQKIKNRTR